MVSIRSLTPEQGFVPSVTGETRPQREHGFPSKLRRNPKLLHRRRKPRVEHRQADDRVLIHKLLPDVIKPRLVVEQHEFTLDGLADQAGLGAQPKPRR